MCGDVKRLPGTPNGLDLLLWKKGLSLLQQSTRGLFINFDLVSDCWEMLIPLTF